MPSLKELLAASENAAPNVADGDTYRREDGSPVRLAGGNTGEISRTPGEPSHRGAHTSRRALADFLDNAEEINEEVLGKDYYGRDLARITNEHGEDYMAGEIRAGRANTMSDNGYYAVDRAEAARALEGTPEHRSSPEGLAAAERAANTSAYSGDYRQTGNTFSSAFARGGNNMQATLYGFTKTVGDLAGVDYLTEVGEEGMARNIREASLNPAEIEQWDDVESLDDLWTFVVEALGENTAQLGLDALMASTGVGIGAIAARRGAMKTLQRQLGPRFSGNWRERATADLGPGYQEYAANMLTRSGQRGAVSGARTGAVASIYPQVVGETTMELDAEGITAPGTALATGVLKTGLEYAPLEMALKSVSKIVGMDTGSLANLATRIVGMSGVEGSTEAVQTVLDKVARNYEQGVDLMTLSESDMAEIRTAAAKGAAVGGGITTAAGTVPVAKKGFRSLGQILESRAQERAAGTGAGTGADPGADPAGAAVGGDVPPVDGSGGAAQQPQGDQVTNQEGPESVAAQLEAMRKGQKNGMFLSAEDRDSFAEVREAARSMGLETYTTGEGMTVGPKEGFDWKGYAKAYKTKDLATRNRMRAELLGYDAAKEDIKNPATAKAVRAVTPTGAEIHGELADAENVDAVAAKVEQTYPDATIQVTSPEQALDNRAANVEQQTEGVSDEGPEQPVQSDAGDGRGGDGRAAPILDSGEGGREGSDESVRVEGAEGDTTARGQTEDDAERGVDEAVQRSLSRFDRNVGPAERAAALIDDLPETNSYRQDRDGFLAEGVDPETANRRIANALQLAVQQQREEPSGESINSPERVREAVGVREATRDGIAAEEDTPTRMAAAFDSAGMDAKGSGALYGVSLKNRLKRLGNQHPTFEFFPISNPAYAQSPETAPAKIGVRFKQFKSVAKAEKEVRRLEKKYPNSQFEPQYIGKDFVLLESKPPADFAPEVDGASTHVAKLFAKAQENAQKAENASNKKAKQAERTRDPEARAKLEAEAKDERDKIVVLRRTETGKTVRLHAPTLTELGEKISGPEGDVRGYLDQQLGRFYEGMAAVLATGYEQVHPKKDYVFLRSKGPGVRGADVVDEKKKGAVRDRMIDELNSEMAKARKRGADESVIGGLKDQLEKLGDERRSEGGQGYADTTTFDKNEIVEETGGMDTEAEQGTFGETVDENKKAVPNTYSVSKPKDVPARNITTYGPTLFHRKWLKGITEALGLKIPIAVVDISNNTNMRTMLRELDPSSTSRAALKQMEERFASRKSVEAQVIVGDDRAYILVRGGPMSQERYTFVLGHELGHIAYQQMKTDVMNKHDSVLRAEFAKAQQALRDEGKPEGQYFYDDENQAFEEWFADRFSAWMIGQFADGRSKLAKIFGDLYKGMRKVYTALVKSKGVRTQATNPAFNKFMKEMIAKEQFHTSVMPHSNGPRDSLAEAVKAHVSGEKTRQYGTKVKDFLSSDLPKMLPFVFTADRELRSMGDIGRQLADLFSQQSSSTRHKDVTGPAYFPGVSTQRARWNYQWDKLAKEMSNAELNAALEELSRADENAPGALSPNAAKINNFFQDYRSKYLTRRMKDIGKKQVYFPRMFNMESVEKRRGELVDLLTEEFFRGKTPPDGADARRQQHATIARAQARERAHATVEEILNAGGSIEFAFTETTRPLAPSFGGRFKQTLKGPTISNMLRQNGFLMENNGDVVRNYLASSTKYAEFSRVAGPDGKQLQDLINQLPTQAEKERARLIVEGYMGRIGMHSDPRVVKGMSWVMVFESYLTLMFAAVASIPDLAGPVIRSRDMDGAKEAFKALSDAFGNWSDVKERAKLLGVLNERMTHQALKEAYGQSKASTGAQKALDKLFAYNQQQRLTDFSRTISATVAERFLISNAEKALAGDARSKRYLKELNVTAEEVQAWDNSGRTMWDNKPGQGDEMGRVQEALHQFIDESVIRPNASQRPVWANHPMAMLLWHLKSFFWAYGKVVLGGIARESASRYSEAKGKGGAAALGEAGVPMAIAGVMLFPLAVLARVTRELIQYGFDDEEKPSKQEEPLEYFMARMSDAGIMGPFELIGGATRYSSGPEDTAANLAGPAFSHLNHFASNGLNWATLKRATPGMNQLPWLNDLVKDTVQD